MASDHGSRCALPGELAARFGECDGEVPGAADYVKLYPSAGEYQRESAVVRRVREVDPDSQWTVVPHRWCALPTRLLRGAPCGNLAKLGDEDRVPVAVMRNAGDSLYLVLKRRSPALAEIRTMAGDVAAGLRALHRGGVWHLDVKPENICPGARARLIDFGLGAVAEDVGQRVRDQAMNVNYPPGLGMDGERARRIAEVQNTPEALLELLADPPRDLLALPPAELGTVVDGWGLGFSICAALQASPGALAELTSGGDRALRRAVRGLLSADPARVATALDDLAALEK